jgi:hypothetical protein
MFAVRVSCCRAGACAMPGSGDRGREYPGEENRRRSRVRCGGGLARGTLSPLRGQGGEVGALLFTSRHGSRASPTGEWHYVKRQDREWQWLPAAVSLPASGRMPLPLLGLSVPSSPTVGEHAGARSFLQNLSFFIEIFEQNGGDRISGKSLLSLEVCPQVDVVRASSVFALFFPRGEVTGRSSC